MTSREVREYLRANRRGTFTVGVFDSIKSKAAEVADLVDKIAEERVRFYAPDIDRMLRSMSRIQLELSNIEIGLKEYRRQTP